MERFSQSRKGSGFLKNDWNVIKEKTVGIGFAYSLTLKHPDWMLYFLFPFSTFKILTNAPDLKTLIVKNPVQDHLPTLVLTKSFSFPLKPVKCPHY